MGGDKLFPRARPLCCRQVVPPTGLGRHSGQRPCCRADEPPGEHSRGLRWTRAGPAGKPETPEGRGGSPEGTLGAQSAPALTPGLAPVPAVTRGLSLGVRAGCTLCLPRAPLRSQGATPPAGRGSGGHTRTCPSLHTACPLEATGSTRPGVSGARTPPHAAPAQRPRRDTKAVSESKLRNVAPARKPFGNARRDFRKISEP